ncbi:hypothetical protein [uncultured Mediterranean phage uvDeep-CGR2-KM19-C37]|nr:hypothetical protein [uncultured Mediterranean phage uvDeep-CGR2-KM19-C37]
MTIRDRIKAFRRVPASSLIANPRNWRTHPKSQVAAMKGILAEVGWADASLVREVDGKLVLIDGHLRKDVAPDAEVPVLVLDVDEAEADKILATHDPIAAMATADEERLAGLLHDMLVEDEAVQAMIDGLAAEHNIDLNGEEPADDPGPELDKAAELQKKWGTETGQVWQCGRHVLICGDAGQKEVAKRVGIVDGACTDPPYDLSEQDVSDVLTRHCDCAVVLASDKLAFALTRLWVLRLDMIWFHRRPRKLPSANVPIMHHNHVLVLTRHADIVTGWKKPRPGFSSVIQLEHEYDASFGYAKSAELYRTMLAGFDWKTVIDPFAGSAAIIVACEQDGRRGIAVEKEPATCAIALERLLKIGLQSQLLTDS